MSAKNRQAVKLTYFDVNARAGLPRLILAVANVKYEDDRVPAIKDGKPDFSAWGPLKPTTLLGSLPTLTVGDVVLAESFQITRYLGEEYQMSGDNALSRAKVNVVGAIMYDFLDAFLGDVNSIGFMKPGDKHEGLKKFMTDHNGKHKAELDKIEKLIGVYGSNGFSAANKMTWADLGIFLIVDYLNAIDASVLKGHPHILKVAETVGKNHLVTDHMKNRPQRPA